MKGFWTALSYLLVSAALTASCATSGGYWIPPSSLPTRPPEVAFLPGTDGAALDPSPTLVSSPTPDQPLSSQPVETEAVFTAPPTLLAQVSEEPVEEIEPGLPTLPPPTLTPEVYVASSAPILYYAQAADTLPVVAVRFGVSPAEISSPEQIPQTGFINPGQLLIIPRRLANTTSSQHLLPDSEVVYSPSAADFDVEAYVKEAGGYLSQYSEFLGTTGTTTGAQVIQRVATEFSVNPGSSVAGARFSKRRPSPLSRGSIRRRTTPK